jgi:hypothetical protein
MEIDISQEIGCQIVITFLCSLSPLVAVMQSADPGQLNYFATLVRLGLGRTSRWCVLSKPVMGSIVMIIVEIRR